MNTVRTLSLAALATLSFSVGPAMAQYTGQNLTPRQNITVPMGGDGGGGASDVKVNRDFQVVPPGAGGDGSAGSSDVMPNRDTSVIPPGAGGDGGGTH